MEQRQQALTDRKAAATQCGVLVRMKTAAL